MRPLNFDKTSMSDPTSETEGGSDENSIISLEYQLNPLKHLASKRFFCLPKEFLSNLISKISNSGYQFFHNLSFFAVFDNIIIPAQIPKQAFHFQFFLSKLSLNH